MTLELLKGNEAIAEAAVRAGVEAMGAGQHVTWIPSYGPEMRGGTAHCTVIISDDEIGSPLVEHPSAVIAMNQPTLDKYAPLMAPGGLLIHCPMPAALPPASPEARRLEIPANAVADELGCPQAANMVLVGALLAATHILPLATVEATLVANLPERHRHALTANLEALRQGAALAAPLPL